MEANNQGYIWETGEVRYEPEGSNTPISLGNAPHAKVTDVALFDAQFPGVILGALNGTSIKVLSQAKTRRMLIANRKVSVAEMQAAVLNALRGVRSRGSIVVKQTFTFGDREFSTKQAANEYATAVLRSKGLDDETIAEILEIALADEVEA